MSFIKVADKTYIQTDHVGIVRGVFEKPKEHCADGLSFYIKIYNHTYKDMSSGERYSFKTEEEAQRVLDEIVGAK